MGFKEFFNMMERTYGPLGNLGSWKPLGMTIPNPVFGALPSTVTGSDTPDSPLSSGGYMGTNQVNQKFDLMLPSITKQAKVLSVKHGRGNNMFIFLNDGTKLYIPYDAFKKINVEPSPGRTLSVIFQRRSDDHSPMPSSIKSIKCN